MQIVYFKERVEKFQVIHVTEGLSPKQVKRMNFTYTPDLQEAIQTASESLPRRLWSSSPPVGRTSQK
jgi:hypothetical protein